MIDANEDKIITKKECEDAPIFDWVDSKVYGDPSHPMAVRARDVAQCTWYWKVWNEVDQDYKYEVKTDFTATDCALPSIGLPSSLPTEN